MSIENVCVNYLCECAPTLMLPQGGTIGNEWHANGKMVYDQMGFLAQLVEHRYDMAGVAGSSPAEPTNTRMQHRG